jgi:hypothetical protein
MLESSDKRVALICEVMYAKFQDMYIGGNLWENCSVSYTICCLSLNGMITKISYLNTVYGSERTSFSWICHNTQSMSASAQWGKINWQILNCLEHQLPDKDHKQTHYVHFFLLWNECLQPSVLWAVCMPGGMGEEEITAEVYAYIMSDVSDK